MKSQGRGNVVQLRVPFEGYRCFHCETEYPQKVTLCPGCHAPDSMTPVRERDPSEKSIPARRAKRASKILARESPKISTGSVAWDEALDGGLVMPSSLLVAGEAGVGKSTQAIAIAAYVARTLARPVLYGSAEMPESLFASIARKRLGLSTSALEKVYVTDTNDLESLLADVDAIDPCMVVVDSMQRYRVDGETGEAVLLAVVHEILSTAKEQDFVAMLISQVTKGEDFAGSNTIRHDVDCVVNLAKVSAGLAVQVLDKNRHGRTPLVGVEPRTWEDSEVPVSKKKRKPLDPLA